MPRRRYEKRWITFKWFMTHPCTHRKWGASPRNGWCHHPRNELYKEACSEYHCPLWQEIRELNAIDECMQLARQDGYKLVAPYELDTEPLPLYTVQRVTKRSVRYGVVHYSEDAEKTLCGRHIDSHYWINTNDRSTMASCKLCRFVHKKNIVK